MNRTKLSILVMSFVLMLVLVQPTYALLGTSQNAGIFRAGGVSIFTGKLEMKDSGNTSRFSIAGNTGNLISTPTATTGNAWYLNANSITTGNALKIRTGAGATNGLAINVVNSSNSSVFNVNSTGDIVAKTIKVTEGIVATKVVRSERIRVPITALNAGAVTLAESATDLYLRIVDVKMIAVGGNLAATAAATGIKITAKNSSDQTIAVMTVLNAALTRSTVVTPTSSNVTVLADGASFDILYSDIFLDVVTAGARDLTTATHIDVIISYVYDTDA